MLKLSVFIRLMPSDENDEAKLSKQTEERLASICAGIYCTATQLFTGAGEPTDIIIESREDAPLSRLTTNDIVTFMDSLAQLLRTEKDWCWHSGAATGWDDDGFILKADIADGKASWASPNWLLTKSTVQMKELQRENYQ